MKVIALFFDGAASATNYKRSERKPHQRTVDETLRVPLALSGHSENV